MNNSHPFMRKKLKILSCTENVTCPQKRIDKINLSMCVCMCDPNICVVDFFCHVDVSAQS